MKAQKIFFVLISLVLFNGCFNKSKELTELSPVPNSDKDLIVKSGTVSNKTVPPSSGSEGETEKFKSIQTVFNSEVPLLKDRMIVRNGTMNIEIENYSESEKKVTEAVQRANGYISNTTSSVNVSGKKQGTIEARVPAEKYEAFVSDISSIGKVMSQNITGNDVTEEYIDLEARQKTQRELEKRLLELLSERTAKLVDVVEVEEKLSEVRENIESTEGRMRFLKSQSSYSTLSVSLFEPALLQTSSGGGFFYEIESGFKKGIEGFTDVLSWLIAFVIAFSPVLIFIGIVIFFVKRFLRNRKVRKENLLVQS